LDLLLLLLLRHRLGHINCSSLKLRRMEANSTAEPFAMVCSRCATRRLRKPQKRLIGR
jgi:hypothetical protein